MSVATSEQLALSHDRDEGPELTWKLPRQLRHTAIDEQATQLLEQNPRSLTLDLRSFKDCEPTAEPHLMDFLTLCARLEIPTPLLIHSTSVRDSNAMANRYRKLFSQRIGGLLLARFASRVHDERGGDHSAAVHDILNRTRSEMIWAGHARAALIPTDARSSGIDLVTESHPKAVRQSVLDELRTLQLTRFERILFDISTCVGEAIDNVRIHSGKQLPLTQPGCMGFIAMRRITRAEVKPLAKQSAPPLRDYWRSHLGSRGAARHLEIVVADNGSGIPATMARTRSVYEQQEDVDQEQKQLQLALGRGSSLRGRGPRRGLGLPQALGAVRTGHGVMIVRTGRIRADARSRGKDKPPLMSAIRRLPYPIGTTLVFVFPEPSARRKG